MIDKRSYKKERRIVVVPPSRLPSAITIQADDLLVFEDISGNLFSISAAHLLASLGDSATSFLNFSSIAEFPTVGVENKIYRDLTSGKSYVWNSTGVKYDLFSSNYEDIKVINGKPIN